jgi:glycosyltransferase involved in cell wall biosynthesis
MRLGGVARMMLNLAEEMLDRGVEVDFFVTRRGGHYWDQLPTGVGIGVGPGGKTPRSLPALVRYLRDTQPTGLVSTHHECNIVSAAAVRLSRTPTHLVARVGNDTSAPRPRTLRRRVIGPLGRLAYRQADHVVATSRGVARDVARLSGVPDAQIDVIYNPVITRGYMQAATEAVDHPWLAPGQPPVVLAASRLTVQKDLPTLLRAFQIVRRQRPARLLILGDGEERPVVENLIRELDLGADAAAPGSVPNPAPYMARASVLCLSSRWEGFGNVLVEAMALGTPVVSTDCPSGPAEILDNGRFGPLVPVGDEAQLAEAIMHTLDDPLPRDELSRRGLEFSADVATSRYLDLLFDGPHPKRSRSDR